MLAFGINEWRDSRKLQQNRLLALENFREEISTNKKIIEKWLLYHSEVLKNLNEIIADPKLQENLITKQGFQFLRFAPRGLYRGQPIKSIAWETAKNANILLLLDFESTYLLSSTYQIQAYGVESTVRAIIDLLIARETFDKSNLAVTLALFKSSFQELTSQEDYLIHIYENALEKLPAN